MKRPLVVVTRSNLPGSGLALLEGTADVRICGSAGPPTREELVETAAGCFGMICTVGERVDASLLEAIGSSLQVVANVAAGYDNIDVAECTRRGIGVGNTPDVLTDVTADLTFALVLATARRVPEAIAAVRAGEWPPWDPVWMCGTGLSGKTLGIVGLGKIGRAVARRAEPFGLEVVHTNSRDGLHLDDLLRRADIVTLHCPLNAATQHLIGEREFEIMKPTAILINTARGGVVDQEALVRALEAGQIWAAGIDVTDPEPLPPTSPLLALPNCVVLPHIGSATMETRTKMVDMAVNNMIAAIRGEPMPHAVVQRRDRRGAVT